MKTDYTSLTPKRNYWIEKSLLGVFVGMAYYSCSSIYNTNTNVIKDVVNTPVAATTSLVCDDDDDDGGGGGGGDDDADDDDDDDGNDGDDSDSDSDSDGGQED